MNIGLDVMGGDFAPEATLKGALLARHLISDTDRIVLFGDRDLIADFLQGEKADPESFDIIHSEEVIGMSEHPLRAYTQKTKSSISRGFKMLKSAEIDTYASAGNSGAMMVGSMYSVKNIPGIIRPCTAATLPKENGGISILLDIGTNPDPKPDVLYQFAILGSVYARQVHNIENPRVGLLNIGEEKEKGNLLMQHTHQMMEDTRDFNFCGNVEGRDLLNDKADVIVCDGFTGNVVLKQIESMHQLMIRRGLNDEFVKRLNYENFGGTPILGVNKPVILGHGISSPEAIKKMILLSKEIFEAKLSEKIENTLSKYPS